MEDLHGPLLTYEHRQAGPWWLLLAALAATFLGISWNISHEPGVAIVLLVAGIFMALLSMSMRHLNVTDEGHQLCIHFGPLPVFRKRIWYEDIVGLDRGRTRFLDGWGIHLSLWGGWVWNIWGFDCVVLRLKRGTLRVGTDDADRLLRFLKTKVSQPVAESRIDTESMA